MLIIFTSLTLRPTAFLSRHASHLSQPPEQTSSPAEFLHRYLEVYALHNDAYVQFAYVCLKESASLRCTRRPPGNEVLDTTLCVGLADEFDSIAGDALLCVL